MDLTDTLSNIRKYVNGLFIVSNNEKNVRQLIDFINDKSKELGLHKILFDDRGDDSDFEKLTFISMTPRQYHKKVMLLTLPQFLVSLYCSLFTSRKVFSKEYWYHSYHVYLVLICSIFYWGNYDNENDNVRKLYRRVDMLNSFVTVISLHLRASKYSKGLKKSTLLLTFVFMSMYILSHYFNKIYPYRSIWFHSMAHSVFHLYNIHHFLTIYRVKLWRLAQRGGKGI